MVVMIIKEINTWVSFVIQVLIGNPLNANPKYSNKGFYIGAGTDKSSWDYERFT